MSQTDIAKNSNKFYIMQIISKDNKEFWLYSRYGRIGDKGVISNMPYPYAQKWIVIKKFCAVFYSKTGNKWGDVFHNKPGKYVMMNIEEPVLSTDVSQVDLSTNTPNGVVELVKMISDQTLFTKTLQKLNVDVKRLPLGKIKKEQLDEADEILKTIELYLAPGIILQLSSFGHDDPDEFLQRRLTELSSSFWTLLPYSCGRNKPPLISTFKILGECAGTLDDIRGIQISTKVIEYGVTPEKIYRSLDAKILEIDRSSTEWGMLLEYVNSSQGATHGHISLIEAFSIVKNFKDPGTIFKNTTNHVLLFHGSRSVNFSGILSSGLRIPNNSQIANGSVLGTGIYFADCVTKSFNYCHDTTGLVLVCEVALGNEQQLTMASSHPLFPGFHSKKACGQYAPDPTGNKKWEKDQSVLVPCGKLKDTIPKYTTGFYYNEYVIYQKEQYRFRYLLKLKKNV